MNIYRATGKVTLHTGKVWLTPKQIEPRSHQLKPVGAKGICEISEPICFKVGELFGYDGVLPKGFPVEIDPEGAICSE